MSMDKPYDPSALGPAERQAFVNGKGVGYANCVRIIERHIEFWQRREGRSPNEEIISELKNILQEINGR
jgi:hypothetical protein